MENMENDQLGQLLKGAELVYQADIQFTDEIDFGVTMQAIMSGQQAIPLAGARFDQTFTGKLSGPQLEGTMEGTDYLRVRADGRFELHLHGRVTSHDGVRIAMTSEGVSLQGEGGRGRLRASVSLHCSDERYQWLNQLQLWALGEMDPATGQAVIAAYSL
jgi:hypothetical protein